MKEIKFGTLTITEKDREQSITINEDIFTVRVPLPSEKARIITQTSRALGGQNINSFIEEDYQYIKRLVTLNNVIVKNPDWWPGAENCLDPGLLDKLWELYLDAEEKFQDFLKKNNRKQK